MKCKNCGTIQFPPQRVCTNCHQKDNFESIRMSDKKAKVFLFVIKPDVPAYMRPGIDTMVDFEGGGRAIFGMTDIALPAKVESKDLIGSEVEMSLQEAGRGGTGPQLLLAMQAAQGDVANACCSPGSGEGGKVNGEH